MFYCHWSLTVPFRSTLVYQYQTVDKHVHDKPQPVYRGLYALWLGHRRDHTYHCRELVIFGVDMCGKMPQCARTNIASITSKMSASKNAYFRRNSITRRICQDDRLVWNKHYWVECTQLLSTIIFWPVRCVTKAEAPALLEMRADRWNPPIDNGRFSFTGSFLPSPSLSCNGTACQWFTFSLSKCNLFGYFLNSISVYLFWKLSSLHASASLTKFCR